MPTYLNAAKERTTADDLSRLIWYSVCGYWHDDWDRICKVFLHPSCPACCMNMDFCTVKEWIRYTTTFEHRGHPHYTRFMDLMKGKCGHRIFVAHSIGLEFAYNRWKEHGMPSSPYPYSSLTTGNRRTSLT